ncbi:MAG TPA: 6-hydroxymethylpterin diphosphokinase MptE-like protein [Nitrososphaerales archaeon]
MDSKQWQKWYAKIVNKLNYNPEKDKEAALLLGELLKGRETSLENLRQRAARRPILIFGAGPSLETDIERIIQTQLLEKCCLITADGATTGLLKVANKNPDIIVTDLDGVIEDIQTANKRGAYIVIHAHGDNMPQLKQYVNTFTAVIGTIQVEPIEQLHNFGGFTDGDRAVFLAGVLSKEPIALAGMNLGDVVGKYSKKQVPSTEVKRIKLRLCKELLEWFASNSENDLYNVTADGEDIRGFKRKTPSELERIISG